MDFCHLIVTCLFSMLRLPFDNQKVKGNYAIFLKNVLVFWEVHHFTLVRVSLYVRMRRSVRTSA